MHRKSSCDMASESSHSLNYQHAEPPPEKVNYKRFPPSTNNQSNIHHQSALHPMNYGYIPDVNYDYIQKDGADVGCFGKRLPCEPGLNPYCDGSSCDSQITHEDVLRDDLLYPYPLNSTEKRPYVYPKTFAPRNATPPCIDPMLPVRGMSASALYNEIIQTDKSEKNAYIPSGTATKLFQRLQQQIQHYKQALSNRSTVSQHEVQQLAQQLMHLSRELLHSHQAASSIPSLQRNLEIYPSQVHSRASRSHKLFSNDVSAVRLRPPALKRDLSNMFEPVGRIGPKQNLMPFQPLLSTDSKRSDFELVNEEKAFFNKISVGGVAGIKPANQQKAQKQSLFQPQIASTPPQPCPQPCPQPKSHPKPQPKPQPENTFIVKQEAKNPQIKEEVKNVTTIVSNVPTQTQVVQQIWDMDSDKNLKKIEKMSPLPAPPEQKEKERVSEKQMSSGSAAAKMEINLNQLQIKQPKKPCARVVKGCEARTSTPNLDQFDRNFSMSRLFEIPEQIGDAVINKTDFLRPNFIPSSARSEKKLTFAANTAFQPRGRGSAPRTLVKVKNTNRSNCEHFNNQNNKLQNSSERFTNRCYSTSRDGDRAIGCCNQNNSKCSLNTYLKHWSIEKELDKIHKTSHGCKKMRVSSCPSKASSANKMQVHFHRALKKCRSKSKKILLCPTCSRHLEVHHWRSAHGNDRSDIETKKMKRKNLHDESDYTQMNTNQNARTSEIEDDEVMLDEKDTLDAQSVLQRDSSCNAMFENRSDFEDSSTFNVKHENSNGRISQRVKNDQPPSSKVLNCTMSSKNVNIEMSDGELNESEDSDTNKGVKEKSRRDSVGEVSRDLHHIPGKSLVKVSEACKELLSFVQVCGQMELNAREINLQKEGMTESRNDVGINKLHSHLSKPTQSENEKLSILKSSKLCKCPCQPCHNCAHTIQVNLSEHHLSRCSVNRLTPEETCVPNNAKMNKSGTQLDIVIPHTQPRNFEKDTTLKNNFLGRSMGDNPGSIEFDKVNRKVMQENAQASKVECQGTDEYAEGDSSSARNFINLRNQRPKSAFLSPPKLELNGFPVQSKHFLEEVAKTDFPVTTPLNFRSTNAWKSNQNTLRKIDNIIIACNNVNDDSLEDKAGNSRSSLNVLMPETRPCSDNSCSSEECMFIFGGVDFKYNLTMNEVEFTKGSSLVLRINSSDRCANFRHLSPVWIRPSRSNFFRWELENLLRCECVQVDRKLHVFGGVVDCRLTELQSSPESEESCDSEMSGFHTLGVLSEHSMGTSEFQSFPHVSTPNHLQEDSLILTKSHDIFDFDSEKWSTGACMPQSLINFSVALWESKIFIIGGISTKDQQQVSNFSLDDRVTDNKYAKDSEQKNFSVVKLRNRLLCYDSISNEWSESSTTPFDNPTIGLSVAVFDDNLFVVGGMSILEAQKSSNTSFRRYKILDSVYKLDLRFLDFKATKPHNFKVDLTVGKEFQNDLAQLFTTEKEGDVRGDIRGRGIWKILKSLKEPRSFGSLVVVKEKLLLVGGLLEEAAESTVEIYDPSTDRWEFFLTLSASRYAMRCAVMGSNLYVSGGFTSECKRFCRKKENETVCREPFCHCRASDLIEAINLTDDDFPKSFVLTRLPLKKIGFQSVMIDAANVLS